MDTYVFTFQEIIHIREQLKAARDHMRRCEFSQAYRILLQVDDFLMDRLYPETPAVKEWDGG